MHAPFYVGFRCSAVGILEFEQFLCRASLKVQVCPGVDIVKRHERALADGAHAQQHALCAIDLAFVDEPTEEHCTDNRALAVRDYKYPVGGVESLNPILPPHEAVVQPSSWRSVMAQGCAISKAAYIAKRSLTVPSPSSAIVVIASSFKAWPASEKYFLTAAFIIDANLVEVPVGSPTTDSIANRQLAQDQRCRIVRPTQIALNKPAVYSDNAYSATPTEIRGFTKNRKRFGQPG